MPKISIIIPLFNQVGFTKMCLEYLERNTPPEIYETILVDNASTDGTEPLLASLSTKFKRIRNSVNLGFAKACNQGAEIATGEYLIFLNNDTVPHNGWAEALLEPLSRFPDIGIVGPKLIYPDGTIQQAGVAFSNARMPYHLYSGLPADFSGANKERFFQAVTGACFLVSRSDFFAVGQFDERYVNGLEDIHFCLAIGKKGKKIFYNPASKVTHFESRSEGRQAGMNNNARIFFDEWSTTIVNDDFRFFVEDDIDFWVNGNTFSFYPTTPGNDRTREILNKADSYFLQGQLVLADKTYRELLQRNPYNTFGLLEIAKLMDRLGNSNASTVLKGLAATYSGN